MSEAWPRVSLGECFDKNEDWIALDPTAEYREVTVRLWGKGVVLRGVTTGAEVAADRRVRVRAGQFILSRIDARNGASGVVPPSLDGAIVSGDFPAFEVRRDRLLPEFLGWLAKTQTFVDMCLAASEGTTNRVRLKEDRFLASSIPLPPLAEQRRIVARLDALAAKIEEAKGLQDESAAATGLVSGRFVEKLVNRWRADGINERPLGAWLTDVQYGTSEKTSDDPDGLPILRMGNIQNGRLELTNLKYLQVSEADRAAMLLRRGDILVNRTNSADLVGKSGVFDADGEYGYASYIIRLRLDLAKAIPGLVAAIINSPAGRDYMFRERKQMTGQANVNSKTLREMPIVLPSIEAQAAAFEQIENMRTHIEAAAERNRATARTLNALLPSLLNRAFAGAL